MEVEATTRVPGLWFEDGNLVIQAENTQYRVFRGILAARSPVFQDMLAIPQRPDSELVEGCPFVHLPDPAGEVTPFLKAIFDPEFFAPFPAPSQFDAIVGCLRLSHKYGVDYLRRRALIHFSSGYPTTLSQLDAAISYEVKEKEIPILEARSWLAPGLQAYQIRAIQVAREVDAPWILPRAFYVLCADFQTLGGLFSTAPITEAYRLAYLNRINNASSKAMRSRARARWQTSCNFYPTRSISRVVNTPRCVRPRDSKQSAD